MPPTVRAEVRLHGRRVGAFEYARGGSAFRYEDDLAAPDHRVLGQIFEDDPAAVRRARVGVPAWFANLLPEGALRRQIIREMGGGNVGDFTLLLRLGAYLPGAVTVHGDDEPADDVPPDGDGSDPDHPLRHSLAGVQLKYSVSSDRLTIPVSGDGAWWIVKLPDRSLRDLTLNEYLTMRWLDAAGLPVPPVHVARASEVKGIPEGLVDPDDWLYVIQRFDRAPGGRVHVEDFAQVGDVEPMFKYSESGATYDSLAAVARALTGDDGYHDYVQRLVAMIVTGNTDAHLKNWALIYRDGVTPSLAPVYDFHSLTVYQRFRYAPMALSLNQERLAGNIEVDDFRRTAERVGADPDRTAATVGETVERLREAWRAGVRQEADVRFPALADHYTHRLATLPVCTIP